MIDEEPIDAPAGRGPAPEPGSVTADGWKRDKAGREFISIPGRRGPLYRRGEESIEERIERASRPADEGPKPKRGARKPVQPPPPGDLDLKAIEQGLAEALRSPAMIAGLAGDVYLANHFTVWGPRLARNLVVAAEQNPWLRRQLEQMTAGGAGALMLMSLVGLAGGVLCYVAPPLIYMFNLPAPAMAREMFAIPERKPNATAAPPANADPTAAAVA